MRSVQTGTCKRHRSRFGEDFGPTSTRSIGRWQYRRPARSAGKRRRRRQRHRPFFRVKVATEKKNTPKMAHSVLLHIFVRSPGVTLTNQSDPTPPPTRVVSFDSLFSLPFETNPKPFISTTLIISQTNSTSQHGKQGRKSARRRIFVILPKRHILCRFFFQIAKSTCLICSLQFPIN